MMKQADVPPGSDEPMTMQYLVGHPIVTITIHKDDSLMFPYQFTITILGVLLLLDVTVKT